ncbi:MAG: hypothetical protein SGJ20_09765 [Planctomycetota bacterium]|nr:hypothetical protein [Planctomycetota bacterium]
MTDTTPSTKTFSFGVFSTVPEADKAVAKLLDAGFTVAEISVVCSDKTIERHFIQFEKEEPAGTFTPFNALGGGAIGAALGGLAVLTASAATGGLAILATGGIAAWAGGMVGGLVGAMMTRGVEGELADYYDQAVIAGDILVAVELLDPGPESHTPKATAQKKDLALARQILAEAGAKPLSIRES